MHSDAGDATRLAPGYPIRTPWDHSSVDNSPRTIAASHVLPRPLVPRHPPSALTNLPNTHHTSQTSKHHNHNTTNTTNTKMLASTMQISTHNQPATTPPPTGGDATTP